MRTAARRVAARTNSLCAAAASSQWSRYSWGVNAVIMCSAGAGVYAATSCTACETEEGDAPSVSPLLPAIQKVAPSTVMIEAWTSSRFASAPMASTAAKASTGSGFVYSAEDGLIMTNHHVTRRDQRFPVRFKVIFPSGHVREASYVVGDPELDIALLRVESPRWTIEDDSDRVELVEVETGSSSGLQNTERVVIIGAPRGEYHTMAEGTVELPEGLRDKPLNQALFIHASVQSGMSGGPVVDAAGRVVGVLKGKMGDRGVAEAMAGLPMSERAVAIPIEHADAMAQALLADKPDQYPYRPPTIGMRVEPIDAVDSLWKLDDAAAARRLPVPSKHEGSLPEGLLVRHVEATGVSAHAGLRVGDVIVKCNGVRVRSVADFQRAGRFLSGDSTPSASLVVHRWVSDTDKEEKTMVLHLHSPRGQRA